MKFTVKWLKEYLIFDSSIEELCKKLTSIGLEVENLENPKNQLSGFIVSKIVDIKKHPNADKLSICDVFDGKKNLEIICGANNAKKNLITVLAPLGSIIKPNTNEEFTIKRSKIRGIESNGMLCSENELGLNENSQGIIELDENYKTGNSFSDYIDDEDIKIEIAITPNRIDCAGVYGIARDLSAAGFGKLSKRKVNQNKINFKTSVKLTNNLKNSDCPQFLLRQIKDVKNEQSPDKVIKRIRNSGIKVISSLVDVTNYLTVDYCRPLHIFDLDKIKGNICIRHSKKGEHFLGLDDKEYNLDEGMIVICDDEKIISLAGILGGKNSACDENTNNILLESAYFSPEKIADTGRKLNILSDARYRFERGIDPKSTLEGMEIATEMIIKNCGGKVGSIISDNSFNFNEVKIDINNFLINEVLGVNIEKKFIIEKLEALGCNTKEKDEMISVIPPSWRPDLKIPEDLIEEIARIFGYENIPSQKPEFLNNDSFKFSGDNQEIIRKIKRLLVSRNIMEIISWSFVDSKLQDIFKIDKFVKIQNPISAELDCLRSNLLINLLKIVKNNNNKNIKNFSVFEIGPIFKGYEPGEQSDFVSIIRSGQMYEKNWIEKDRPFDIFDVKADLFSILENIGFSSENLRQSNESKNYYHPGKSGSISFANKTIANFGELHPKVLKKFDLDQALCALELNLTELLTFNRKKNISKNELETSPYQMSIRDFSFEINKNVLSSEVISSIRRIDINLIKDVKIFDSYENKKSNPDLRSLAIEVKIQSDKKTLDDSEIQKISDEIIKDVTTKFNAKLR